VEQAMRFEMGMSAAWQKTIFKSVQKISGLAGPS